MTGLHGLSNKNIRVTAIVTAVIVVLVLALSTTFDQSVFELVSGPGHSIAASFADTGFSGVFCLGVYFLVTFATIIVSLGAITVFSAFVVSAFRDN